MNASIYNIRVWCNYVNMQAMCAGMYICLDVWTAKPSALPLAQHAGRKTGVGHGPGLGR